MDCLNNRNPPFSPFPVNSVTEIRRPPYIGGGRFGDFPGVLQ